MGYSTTYSLDIVGNRNDIDIIASLREEYEGANYALDDFGDTSNSCKWYEHEKDLKEFSLEHPEVLFVLEGEGEDSGDMWRMYIKNGKSQRCNAIITFAEFDPKEFK